MKKALFIVIIALAGVGLLSYPLIANYLSERNSSYAAEEYAEKIAGISEEELQAAWDEAVKYNENLEGNPVHDPFLVGSGMVMADNYNEVLSIEETMALITIPKISVKLPIYHGTADSTLKKGVGHLEGSSLPVGGVGTHSVLTGHTGLTNAKLFTDLIELEEGDLFFIHVLDQTLAYQVDQILVTEPSDVENLKRMAGRDYCTLITCTPYGINSHRLLVRGVRVEYLEEMEEQAAEAKTGWTHEQKLWIAAVVITTSLMALLIVFTVFWGKHKKRKERLEQLRKELLQ